MYEFLRRQYQLGRLDAVKLARYVAVGCITEEQRQTILNEEVAV